MRRRLALLGRGRFLDDEVRVCENLPSIVCHRKPSQPSGLVTFVVPDGLARSTAVKWRDYSSHED